MTGGKPSLPWRPPTRRAFVTMLAAAAAAIAIKDRGRMLGEPADDDRPRSPWTGTTRWIGHC
ncbi:MAG TPA: twin-arginine translocation signal domain-containing protein [Kofleriaceae bacterium]